MAQERKPVTWGQPGQTGVTKYGIPWYVPEDFKPSRSDRAIQRVLRDDGSFMPIGARYVPARSPSEVRERLQRYSPGLAKRAGVGEGEEIDGFIGCDLLHDRIPQPPFLRSAGIWPAPRRLKKWWMGGGWDSMAGELVVAVGGSRNLNYIEKFDRSLTWIRTSARVVIMHDSPDHDGRLVTEYEAGQVGIRPDWQPGERSQRVDVAFADGSWIGFRAKSRVPGGAEDHAVRDLLAELAGPPVTATVLPPLGRE